MARSTTVRLYPMYPEHFRPLVLDAAVLTVASVLLWHVEAIAVMIAVLAHVVQMGWFCAVRFDDAAITIIRPWEVRRIEWTEISGLVHTFVEPLSRTRGGDGHYQLRLVLNDQRDPLRGPVVSALSYVTLLDVAGEGVGRSTSARRLYDELKRHGFPAPRLQVGLVRRGRREGMVGAVPETIESDAVGTDYRVTIHYPDPATNDDFRQVLDTLRAKDVTGPVRIVDDPGRCRVTYLFRGPHAKRAFQWFLDAAREQLPAGCAVSVGAPAED